MRARYYSPEMCRFVNSDILHGKISDSASLNRYSYVNGNPASSIDPFGLDADKLGGNSENKNTSYLLPGDIRKQLQDLYDNIGTGFEGFSALKDNIYYAVGNILKNATPDKMGTAAYNDLLKQVLNALSDVTSPTSKVSTFLDDFSVPWMDGIVFSVDVAFNIYDNIENDEDVKYIISDAFVEGVYSFGGLALGTAIGTAIAPGLGTVAGFIIGLVFDNAYEWFFEELNIIDGKSLKDLSKESWRNLMDSLS